MILVGIDDTDVLGSKGTNQLARAIVQAAADGWKCVRIVRHQLLDDPRIPFTSKNGSASIALESLSGTAVLLLIDLCRRVMEDWFVLGSDPGLCVAENVPKDVVDFGRLCQRQVVSQAQARELAAEHNLYLQGLGGTEGGVIGALAAVGLASTGDDGRIVQHGTWPDDLSGVQPAADVWGRGIRIEDFDSADVVHAGFVDVGKHLRPNRRCGRNVLFVRHALTELKGSLYHAIRLP